MITILLILHPSFYCTLQQDNFFFNRKERKVSRKERKDFVVGTR
jgi:hypothetical protein